MWGPAIVGFGSYHYKYASGREGDMPLIGFSPRKPNLTLYIMRKIRGLRGAAEETGEIRDQRGVPVHQAAGGCAPAEVEEADARVGEGDEEAREVGRSASVGLQAAGLPGRGAAGGAGGPIGAAGGGGGADGLTGGLAGRSSGARLLATR